MSRPSIERRLRRFTRAVRLYVGTSHVVVEISARWQRRAARSFREPIDAGAGFDAALNALDRALQDAASAEGDLRGVACAVVLADGWVLYDAIPIDVVQVPAQSAGSIVAATLADVAGVRADALEVRWQWQRDGRGAFAMAVPRALLARLQGLLAQHGLAPKSVTGEFIAVYNAQRERMTGARVIFAVVRGAGAQIALLSDGIVHATQFELNSRGAAGLSRAAAGVMRARGDDTTASMDYVVDPGSPEAADERDPIVSAKGWSLVSPPSWAAAR